MTGDYYEFKILWSGTVTEYYSPFLDELIRKRRIERQERKIENQKPFEGELWRVFQ